MPGIYETIVKRRSIRKFGQKKIKDNVLLNCLNAARLAPSAANMQPLEYILITENIARIADCLKWAAYLKDAAPNQNELPTACIIILSNTEIKKEPKYDAGLAAENIILTSQEQGIASCIVASIDKEKIAGVLNIPEKYQIEFLIALGYPKQESFEEEFAGDVKYWLDKKGNLHVPKRKLKDIIHYEQF